MPLRKCAELSQKVLLDAEVGEANRTILKSVIQRPVKLHDDVGDHDC